MRSEPTQAVGDATPKATALRAFEGRTRSLSLASQMSECVDLLQAPELVVADVLTSVADLSEIKRAPRDLAVEVGRASADEAFFYAARELFVQGDKCSFTCLATDVAFTRKDEPIEVADEVEARRHGAIDYAAVTCEARPFPILGFTQREAAESAYPLLLRSLSCLIELLAPRRFDLLDREIYRGLLGPAPAFDLALVLWDDEEVPDERRPLCELTRDLAELVKGTLAEEPRFPPILRDIVCLRMNQKRFDGRLRFVWRV